MSNSIKEWTSEDIGNPVYSKKSILPISRQKDLIINIPQTEALKRFDKTYKIAAGIGRLPFMPTATASSIVDVIIGLSDIYNNKPTDNALNVPSEAGATLGGGIDISGKTEIKGAAQGLVKKVKGWDRKYKQVPMSKISGVWKRLIGNTLKIPDTIMDSMQLYDDVVYKKLGGKFTPKRSQLVKDAETISTKRDMRKKVIKSTSTAPILKKSVIKNQDGGLLEYIALDPIDVNIPKYSINSNQFNPYDYINSEPFKEIPSQNESEGSNLNGSVANNIPIQKAVQKPPLSSIQTSSNQFDSNFGLMGDFIKVAKEEGLPFRVTSGYRPKAVTSNGAPSWHSKGLAIDIVPEYGISWDTFKSKLGKSPKTLQWLRNNGFGIIDETSKEMLAKTKGTGAHFHIGKDKLAVSSFNKMFPENNVVVPLRPSKDPTELAMNFIAGTKDSSGWEGFFDKPSIEKASGIWTVGHGLTDPEIISKYKKGITPEQSRQEVYKIIKDSIIPELSSFKWWDTITPELQAALIDARYGLGSTGFKRSKNLLSLLDNNANINDIINEMDWNANTNNGLSDRSGARRALGAGKYDWTYTPYSNTYKGWRY